MTMSGDTLFGGIPGYSKGANWSRIVMHEEPFHQFLDRFATIKTGAMLAGIEVRLNHYMPRDKIIIENSLGEIVSIINLGDQE